MIEIAITAAVNVNEGIREFEEARRVYFSGEFQEDGVYFHRAAFFENLLFAAEVDEAVGFGEGLQHG